MALNFNNTTPAPPSGTVNNVYQRTALSGGIRSVSTYTPAATATTPGSVPTPPNNATKYLDGTGAWSVPVGSTDTDSDATLSTSDITTNDVSITKHGFAPKSPNDATTFLNGVGAYAQPKGTDLTLTDVTTNDVSITKHGFAPKAPNDATKYLNGTGFWTVPAGSGGTASDATLTTSDITTNDVSITKHGFAPKAPNDATMFLNGVGAYAQPKGTDLVLIDVTGNDVSIARHGFTPKAPNDVTKYLNGTGVWSIPPYPPVMNATTSGLVPTPPNDATKFLSGVGTFISAPVKPLTYKVGIVIDGGTVVPATGSKGFSPELLYDGTILSWALLGDASGSAQITVKKTTYAGFPATSSIVAAAAPQLVGAQKNSSSTLTGWTTAVLAGDILEFNLDSVGTCKRLMFELIIQTT